MESKIGLISTFVSGCNCQISSGSNILRSLNWDNRLIVGLKRTPNNFLQVRRINRDGVNKNAFCNIDMTFFIQENANLHLSKRLQLTKEKRFSILFLPRVSLLLWMVFLFYNYECLRLSQFLENFPMSRQVMLSCSPGYE